MRTVSYRLADLNRAVIPLGFVGENQHTRVIFDAAKVFAEYPAAVPALTVQPPQGTCYPAVVVRDGDYVQFDVSDSDLIHAGTGELQMAFVQDAVHVRTFIARTRIDRSIVPTGEIPEPLEDFLEAASAAVAAIPQEVADGVADGFGAVTAEAETLVAGSDATAEFNAAKKVLTIGVPVGADGQDGQPGADGVSPTVAVSPITDGHRVTITDKTGPQSFDVMDGEKGDPGTPGDPTTLIDDTSTTATDKVWSAQKTFDLSQAISQKQDAPASGAAAGKVLGLALVDGQLVPVWDGFPVSDVQVNGTSILSQGVANLPRALSNGPLGLVRIENNSYTGIGSNNGLIFISPAESTQVKLGANENKPIVPSNQHQSTFYGLAKASGDTTQSASSNPVGTYTDAAKKAIRKMLGIPNPYGELIKEVTLTEDATEVIINTDSNGQPFKLSKMIVIVDAPQSTTGTRDMFYGSLFGERQDGVMATTSIPSMQFTSATGVLFGKFIIQINPGMPIKVQMVVSSSEGATQSMNTMPKSVIFNYLTQWKIYQSASDKSLVPAGTNIKLYGIRIDE